MLGPAEGLRRLSLAHQRGLVSTAALETVAAEIEAGETADAPIPVSVLRAYEPESFASLKDHGRGVATVKASERSRSETLPAAVDDQTTQRPSPKVTSTLPDWRSLVSEAEVGAPAGQVVTQASPRGDPGRALAPDTAPANPSLAAAQSPSMQGRAAERAGEPSTTSDPAPPAARDALLDDVERFLSITERDLTLIEELLTDG
ncbi:MAG: hypothetical protein AAF968_09185 [Pseudomonadota bacterium]